MTNLEQVAVFNAHDRRVRVESVLKYGTDGRVSFIADDGSRYLAMNGEIFIVPVVQ